jgi:hypothetical protein
MKFALILVIFGFGSEEYAYVIEDELFATDCAVRIIEQQALLEKTFAVNDFELSCDSYYMME